MAYSLLPTNNWHDYLNKVEMIIRIRWNQLLENDRHESIKQVKDSALILPGEGVEDIWEGDHREGL